MSTGDWDPFLDADADDDFLLLNMDPSTSQPEPLQDVRQQIAGQAGQLEHQAQMLQALGDQMQVNRQGLESIDSSFRRQMNVLLETLQERMKVPLPSMTQDEEQDQLAQYAIYPRRKKPPPSLFHRDEEHLWNEDKPHGTDAFSHDGILVFRPQQGKIGANRHNDLPKARLYNHTPGETFSWPIWRRYYTKRAERMGWSHKTARENLPLYMGEATAFYTTSDIDTTQREGCWTLDDLLDKFAAKFNPAAGAEVAKAIFENSRQRQDEDMLGWHNRTKILYLQAWPGLKDENTLIRHFQKGIFNRLVADWVSDHAPTCYEDALVLASRKWGTISQHHFQLHHQHGHAQGHHQKKYRPRTEPMDVNHLVTAMEARDHSKLICYACNQKGHIRPNCPSKSAIANLAEKPKVKKPFFRGKKKIDHLYDQHQHLMQQLSNIENTISQIEGSMPYATEDPDEDEEGPSAPELYHQDEPEEEEDDQLDF